MRKVSLFLKVFYYQFFVSRWHNRNRRFDEKVGPHAAKVGVIAVLLADLYIKKFPNEQIDRFRVLWVAQTHDIEECYTGDLPGYMKNDHPELAESFEKIASSAREQILLELPYSLQVHRDMSAVEISLIKLADKISGLFYCQEECLSGVNLEYEQIRQAHEEIIASIPDLKWLCEEFFAMYGDDMMASSTDLRKSLGLYPS